MKPRLHFAMDRLGVSLRATAGVLLVVAGVVTFLQLSRSERRPVLELMHPRSKLLHALVPQPQQHHQSPSQPHEAEEQWRQQQRRGETNLSDISLKYPELPLDRPWPPAPAGLPGALWERYCLPAPATETLPEAGVEVFARRGGGATKNDSVAEPCVRECRAQGSSFAVTSKASRLCECTDSPLSVAASVMALPDLAVAYTRAWPPLWGMDKRRAALRAAAAEQRAFRIAVCAESDERPLFNNESLEMLTSCQFADYTTRPYLISKLPWSACRGSGNGTSPLQEAAGTGDHPMLAVIYWKTMAAIPGQVETNIWPLMLARHTAVMVYGDERRLLPSMNSTPSLKTTLSRSPCPLFRQYFHRSMFQSMRLEYVPLGRRAPLPGRALSSMQPILARRYVISFVGSATSGLRGIFARDYFGPLQAKWPNRTVLHLSKGWSVDLSTEALENFLQTMRDSMFVPIIKGHHLEQFRMYEAMAVGAIPVFTKDMLEEFLPKDFATSPAIILASWDDLIPQIEELLKPEHRLQLALRQMEMVKWSQVLLTKASEAIENCLFMASSETA